MDNEDRLLRRMQIKVLYSFDNNPTVFLSRSKSQFAVKVAQIDSGDDNQVLTLGAVDLRNCVHQIVNSSPENFKLNTEDYAVYYMDITEQPDEPFVANGIMSALLASSSLDLVPGRVCQNLSASILFGDRPNASSLTLEIRLKFHVLKRADGASAKPAPEAERYSKHASPRPAVSQHRSRQQLQQSHQQQQQQLQQQKQHISAARRRRPPPVASGAVKATRTRSLPIFYHPPNQQISNIINADKQNAPLRFDSRSIRDRFKLAPFLSAKIIDKPSHKRRRSHVPLTPTVQTPGSAAPQRAMRTRSMMTSALPIVSSPINEDALSEATDDTEYQDGKPMDEIDEEDNFDVLQQDSSSPFTPQQPPYKPRTHLPDKANSAVIVPSEDHQFQSLPDLEDLDSKKTHTITSCKLPPDHGLVCINRNCVAVDSVTWRYFETDNKEHAPRDAAYDGPFEKSMYDGMFGPLCNACYRFLRTKGFMRPEAVVKKYLQQQKYKKDVKSRDAQVTADASAPHPLALAQSSPFSSTPQTHKFATPSYFPAAINEAIKSQATSKMQFSGSTPFSHTPGTATDCQDINDFIDSFGGPLTDIDIPTNDTNPVVGVTPPMVATKCNTRVINLAEGSDDSDENKENTLPLGDKYDFDQIMNSFGHKSSPDHDDWALFGEPTPKDGSSSGNMNDAFDAGLPQLRTFKLSPSHYQHVPAHQQAAYMPSSPLASGFKDSSPPRKARRTDTTMSYIKRQKSSPQSEVYPEDTKV